MSPSTTTPKPPEAVVATRSHPRIRARRIEIKRDEGRRRRHRLLVLAAVLAVAASLAGLTRSPLLDIDRLVVDGAARTGSQAVLARAGLHRGEAMVDVDPSAVSHRVRGLPWVAHASVQRRWPGTVRLVVVERRAVAQVRAGAAWAAVDAQGRVLELRLARDGALVEVSGGGAGPPGSRLPAAVRPVLALVPALAALAHTHVRSVGAVHGEVAVVLAEGARVVIGRPDQVAAKLYALDAMVAAEKPQCLDTVDVRVPSAPVLTRKTGCA